MADLHGMIHDSASCGPCRGFGDHVCQPSTGAGGSQPTMATLAQLDFEREVARFEYEAAAPDFATRSRLSGLRPLLEWRADLIRHHGGRYPTHRALPATPPPLPNFTSVYIYNGPCGLCGTLVSDFLNDEGTLRCTDCAQGQPVIATDPHLAHTSLVEAIQSRR